MAKFKIKCPVVECEYECESDEAVIAASLLNIHATTHTQHQAASNTSIGKVEKLKRPTISSAGTSEQWEYFLTRWDEYRNGTHLQGTDAVIQLLECCDETLRKDLTNAAGKSLANETEDYVLNAMKALAIRGENIMVARVTLLNMRQGQTRQ